MAWKVLGVWGSPARALPYGHVENDDFQKPLLPAFVSDSLFWFRNCGSQVESS